jgi:hypothetical protein
MEEIMISTCPTGRLWKTGLVSLLLVVFISFAIGCSHTQEEIRVVVYDGCILPPSSTGAKNESALKASFDAVKLSPSIEVTFKSEAIKLREVNPDLVKLYALGSYCLMSRGKNESERTKLLDAINSIVNEISVKKEGGIKTISLTPAAFEKLGDPPPPRLVSDVTLELRSITESLASDLSIPVRNLRANVFMLAKNDELKIPKGFYVRLFDSTERTLSFTPGHGATGVAFSSQGLLITMIKEKKGFFVSGGDIFLASGWSIFIFPEGEQAKVDPNLAWIFSAAIKTDAGEVIGVLNVDCVGEGCESVKAQNLSAKGDREMRIASARIGNLLQAQIMTATVSREK